MRIALRMQFQTRTPAYHRCDALNREAEVILKASLGGRSGQLVCPGESPLGGLGVGGPTGKILPLRGVGAAGLPWGVPPRRTWGRGSGWENPPVKGGRGS